MTRFLALPSLAQPTGAPVRSKAGGISNFNPRCLRNYGATSSRRLLQLRPELLGNLVSSARYNFSPNPSCWPSLNRNDEVNSRDYLLVASNWGIAVNNRDSRQSELRVVVAVTVDRSPLSDRQD